MSLKPKLLTLSSVVACGALLFSASHLSSSEVVAVPQNKSAKFLPSSLKLAKPNQALDVSIEPVDGFPEFNDEVAHLRATIQTQLEPGTSISYKWILPEGASVDSGNLDGALIAPAEGQELVLDFYIRGFSSEGDVRNLKLNVEVPSQSVGNTALFSSHPTRSDLSRGFREAKSGRSLDPAVRDEQSKPRLPAGVNL